MLRQEEEKYYFSKKSILLKLWEKCDTASAVEINNEKVTDLVCGKQNDLVEDKNGNFKVANLTFC